jgi:hypothetical protein
MRAGPSTLQTPIPPRSGLRCIHQSSKKVRRTEKPLVESRDWSENMSYSLRNSLIKAVKDKTFTKMTKVASKPRLLLLPQKFGNKSVGETSLQSTPKRPCPNSSRSSSRKFVGSCLFQDWLPCRDDTPVCTTASVRSPNDGEGLKTTWQPPYYA